MEILEKVADVKVNPKGRPLTIEEVKEVARDYNPDGFVSTCYEPYHVFSREVIEVAKNLKVIGWVGAGFEHIDLDAAAERGVYVTFLKDVVEKWIATTLADDGFALLLCAARKMHLADRYTKEGKWVAGGMYPQLALMGSRISGTTIGIIGMGRIGGEVAKRAKGFDMNILYYDVRQREDLERELGAKKVSLEELLRQSDFVAIHCPLNKETEKLIGKKELALMKKTAILVSNARGGIIDGNAVYEALKNGVIGGAALDVFESEPIPLDHPILKLDNVVLAPHIGGGIRELIHEQALKVADDVVKVITGHRPPYLLNPEVLKVRPLPP
jgi:lactate dehydrogenase-like 2-hydroxyacid dehydrogenase